MTFKQARELGGHVRKGEKGFPVVFWKRWTVTDTDDNGEQIERQIPLLRYYTVFNASQVDGIDTPDLRTAPLEPIAECERVVSRMPHAPQIVHGGDVACYRPATDTVFVPPRDVFRSAPDYYATSFHELTHSTGHLRD